MVKVKTTGDEMVNVSKHILTERGIMFFWMSLV